MQNDEELNQYSEFDELDFGGKRETVEEQEKYVEQNLWSKLASTGKKISFGADIIALYNYMKDPFVSWQRKALIVGALLYFILPIDSIPDIMPIVGYLDDLGVITALIKHLGSELVPYYE